MSMTPSDIHEHLPQGSGWDKQWYIEATLKNGKVVFGTKFHVMDEHGVYRDWIPVRIKVDLKAPDMYTVSFCSNRKMAFDGKYHHLQDGIVEDIWYGIKQATQQFVRKELKHYLEEKYPNLTNDELANACKSHLKMNFSWGNSWRIIADVVGEEPLIWNR